MLASEGGLVDGSSTGWLVLTPLSPLGRGVGGEGVGSKSSNPGTPRSTHNAKDSLQSKSAIVAITTPPRTSERTERPPGRVGLPPFDPTSAIEVQAMTMIGNASRPGPGSCRLWLLFWCCRCAARKRPAAPPRPRIGSAATSTTWLRRSARGAGRPPRGSIGRPITSPTNSRKAGLKPGVKDGSYFQQFALPANSLKGSVPGADRAAGAGDRAEATALTSTPWA